MLNNVNSIPTQLFMSIMNMNPIVSLVGVITNSINIAVFLNPQLKDPTYRYMLCHSLSNFFYLIILSLSIVSECKKSCTANRIYFSKIYNLVLIEYFTSSLALFSILIDINLSIQRYMKVSKSQLTKFFEFKMVVSVIFLFSLIFYAPLLHIYEIVPIFSFNTNKTISFDIRIKTFSNKSFGYLIPIFLTSIRIFLATVLLGSVNILSALKFYNHFKTKTNKVKLKSESAGK
jgi:hypothetical protein